GVVSSGHAHLALEAVQPLIDDVQVGKDEIRLDGGEIAQRGGRAAFLEGTYHEEQGVNGADVSENCRGALQTGAAGQAGDVDELDLRRLDALRLEDVGEHVHTRVGHLHYCPIGLALGGS